MQQMGDEAFRDELGDVLVVRSDLRQCFDSTILARAEVNLADARV